MRSNVTAILVAHRLGDHLTETISALRAQSIDPDRVIAVVTGSDELAAHLGAQGFDAVIKVNPKYSFGAAVAAAVRGTDPLGEGPEWLWFLAEDSAPEPDALMHLLLSVKTTGTAAVAGPKLVDWDDPSRIIELSQGLTWSGARWVLDRDELDQEQYDHYEDVLGVGPAGMLVRRDVWERLGGFDPALPVYDDGLDFSVRARLAGYRVVVAPEARLRFARTGIAGPQINHRNSVLQRAHRRARTAQLHRRVTYAPAIIAPFIWLALPIIGVLGMLWALIRERPGTMIGELLAALTVFFRPGRIIRSRRNLRKHSTAGWGAVRPLRTDRKTERSVRAVRKEAILAAQGRGRTDLHFIHTGGLGLTIGTSLAAVVLFWWLLGGSFITGGGAGLLSSSIRDLWANTISAAAVDVRSLGTFADTVPADPFTWVLALIGSVTFWNPSYAILLLILLAIPVASLGGWMWSTQFTEHTAGRLLGGIAWGFAPVLMASLLSGRLPAIVLAMTLPWFLHALSRASRSWSWAGVSSFLAAIALAAAPSLIPAAIVLLVLGILTHPRGGAKLLSIAIVPLALFAPKILGALATGKLTNLVVDPGVQQPYEASTLGELLLGFPEAGLGGFPERLTAVGLSEISAWTIALALATPLVLLALVGVFTERPRRSVLIAIAGLLGLATAIVAPHLQLVPLGEDVVAVWAGSGVALYWIALITFAVSGTRVLAKGQLPVAIVAMLGAVALVAPSLVGLVTAHTELRVDRQVIPAVMNAELRSNPDAQALLITPLGEEALRSQLVGAESLALDRIRTATVTADASEEEAVLAELVAALSSVGATGLDARLDAAGITFVLLEESTGAGGSGLRSLMQVAFDQNEALSPVGATDYGLLWRAVAPAEDAEAGEATEAHPDSDAAAVLAEDQLDIDTTATRPVSGKMLWIVQLVLLGAMFLLALPTGEVRARPHRRRRVRSASAAVGEAAVVNELPEDAKLDEQSDTTVRDDSEVGETTEIGDDADIGDDTGEIPVFTREDYELPDDDTIFVGGVGDPLPEAPDTPAKEDRDEA